MKKIILSILIFFYLYCFTYWFDWKISVDKENININENIKLNISISSNWNRNIDIKEIKWIENFEIISKSESQSSSISSKAINWETKIENNTNYFLNIILTAKEKWVFTIWPAIIEENWKENKTNTIKIKVDWEKLKMLSPDIPNINNNQYSINNDNLNEIIDDFLWNRWNFDRQKIENLDTNKTEEENNNNYFLYFLIIFLIIFLILTIYLYNKSNKKLKERINKLETKKDFIYPNNDDENFLYEIEKIFKIKIEDFLQTKIQNKTYTEILSNYDFKEKTETIKDIVSLINKLKYSNHFVDKNEVVDLLKNL